jgi:hypothetical protein
MSKKHIKIFSAVLPVRKMQMKTTVKILYTYFDDDDNNKSTI